MNPTEPGGAGNANIYVLSCAKLIGISDTHIVA